jgi:hypothetical protein
MKVIEYHFLKSCVVYNGAQHRLLSDGLNSDFYGQYERPEGGGKGGSCSPGRPKTVYFWTF